MHLVKSFQKIFLIKRASRIVSEFLHLIAKRMEKIKSQI